MVTFGALLAAASVFSAGFWVGRLPWAALIASTSWAFFMAPEPAMPMPLAIALRSARSMELSPPAAFFFGAAPTSDAVVISVT